MLLGRSDEIDAIGALIAAAREGSSGILVLDGEAGIGKTALLQHAEDAADGLTVARARGTESELGLDFAGLHQLLLPFLAAIDELPAPQRDALGAAFGLVTADAVPDPWLVGLAALTLLADAAAERPVLCLIDDAQWLDQESVGALTFVARRLHAERIALLSAVRTPTTRRDPFAAFPRRTVGGLDAAGTAALLDLTAAAPSNPQVAERVLAETGGNPLAVEVLGHELTTEQVAGVTPLPTPLPVGDRLEASFLQQARDLPAATQTLLLVAAAEPSGDPAVIRTAAELLEVEPEAADPAAAIGLLAFRSGVELRHPLARSAIYEGADPAERRRVHRALADATDGERDPDRRAWHLAAACLLPDESVATALARSAVRARSRGGYAAEATLLARAAELSPGADDRVGRLLDAARAALDSGNPRRAERLVDRAEPDLRTPWQQATARRLQGSLQAPLGRPALGSVMLLEAARAFVPLDRDLACSTFAAALDGCNISGAFTEGTTAVEVATAALELLAVDDADTSATLERLLLVATAELAASGFLAASPALRRGSDRLWGSLSADDLAPVMLLTPLLSIIPDELFDNALQLSVSQRVADFARRRGSLATLQGALLIRANAEIRRGAFAEAAEGFAEVVAVTEMIGQHTVMHALMDVELIAWRGDAELTRSKTETIEQIVDLSRTFAPLCATWCAGAVLHLGQGRYHEAFDAARKAVTSGLAGYVARALPNLVEAAARCGEHEEAAAALEDLRVRSGIEGATPAIRGIHARSAALLADDDEAEASYRTAIDLLEDTDLLPEVARAHLVYGEWLRRTNRRVDAREHLRTAHGLFADMGAQAFAGRARIELEATGERARRRTVETATDLTPQEAQIARLAAARATSREIAAQLFISPKTVEYHLGKVFRKLDISSRRELPDALRAAGRA